LSHYYSDKSVKHLHALNKSTCIGIFFPSFLLWQEKSQMFCLFTLGFRLKWAQTGLQTCQLCLQFPCFLSLTSQASHRHWRQHLDTTLIFLYYAQNYGLLL